MTPPLVKAGIVLLDPASGRVTRIIPLQYNPESLTRSFQVQAPGEGADRSEALRLRGLSVETLKVEAAIDAADLVGTGEENLDELGIHPQLAVLEGLIQPLAEQLQSNNELAKLGTLEIVPMQSPLVLFVFGKNRVVPVQVTELSVTEEAFDPNLNPLRAKVSLGLRVITVDDVGFEHQAGSLFMTYLQQRQSFGALARGASLSTLGLVKIP
jgi:hypothetical protein